MTVSEEPVVFGPDRALLGIVSSGSDPEHPPRTGAIFLNSGLVHRVGPNRMWVEGGRRWAARGIPALRFDHSGVGDSLPSRDDRAIGERWVSEARMAMDELARATDVERFLVVGNCSGAIGALLTAEADPRVAGVVVINLPPPRIPLRYFVRLSTTRKAFWARVPEHLQRILAKGVGGGSGGGPGGDTRPSDTEVVDRLASLCSREKDVFLVHSEWDPGNDYFHRTLRRRLEGGAFDARLERRVVEGANHDFSLIATQGTLLARLDDWAARRGFGT